MERIEIFRLTNNRKDSMKKLVLAIIMMVCSLSAMAAGWSTFLTDPNPTVAQARTQLAAIGFTQAQIDYAFKTMGTANAITMARVASLSEPFKQANLQLINLGLTTAAGKSVCAPVAPPKAPAVPAPSDTQLAFKAVYSADYTSLLRLLVAGNVDVNALCPYAVWNTFNIAASAGNNYTLINGISMDMNAPLISYVVASKFTTAQKAVLIGLLIKRGASVNTPSMMGFQTPIFYAVARGDAEIVSMLLQLGADPRAIAQGVTWKAGTQNGKTVYEYVNGASSSTIQSSLLTARSIWYSYSAKALSDRIATYTSALVAKVSNIKV